MAMQFFLSVRGPKDKRGRYTSVRVCSLVTNATMGAAIREAAALLHGDGVQVERVNDIAAAAGFYQAYTWGTNGDLLNLGALFIITDGYPFFVEDN